MAYNHRQQQIFQSGKSGAVEETFDMSYVRIVGGSANW